MVTIVIPNIYTTPYTTCSGDYCVQKTVIIPGEPGKKIKIDALALSMCIAATGATATAWVTTDISGVTAVIANWTETGTAYKPKSATPGFIAEEGKDVVLKWNLKTSDATKRAKMKDLTYTYTVTAPEPIDAECLVVIECETQEEADALATSLADKGANVYTRKAN